VAQVPVRPVVATPLMIWRWKEQENHNQRQRQLPV
jgi:hypothetical protein